MRSHHTWISAAALIALGAVAGSGLAEEQSASAPEASAWQHHHTSFTYSAFTTHYSCDGLEGKVASILRYFGARKTPLTVRATGCPRGPDSLSRMIWVTVDFDTLGAAPADAPAADIVQAHWMPLRVDGQRPFFMTEGDCELIQSMKPVLTQNFSLRDLAYDTSCTPHQQTLLDFRIKGEVLKSASGHDG